MYRQPGNGPGGAPVGTGFPVHTSPENNLDYFSAFVLRAQGIRRAGSAAADMAYVAAGPARRILGV